MLQIMKIQNVMQKLFDTIFDWLMKILWGIFMTLVFSFWAVFLLILGYHIVRLVRIGLGL